MCNKIKIIFIDENGKEVKEEKLPEILRWHLRWRCEDYLERNKNKDIVIDTFGNINCTNCKDCENCTDCTDCAGCIGCIKCEDCEHLDYEFGAILKCKERIIDYSS